MTESNEEFSSAETNKPAQGSLTDQVIKPKPTNSSKNQADDLISISKLKKALSKKKKLHLKTRNKNLHACNLCDRSYSQMSELRIHFKSLHLNKMRHKCNLCDYGSYLTGALKSHKKTHAMIKEQNEHIQIQADTIKDELNYDKVRVKFFIRFT